MEPLTKFHQLDNQDTLNRNFQFHILGIIVRPDPQEEERKCIGQPWSLTAHESEGRAQCSVQIAVLEEQQKVSEVELLLLDRHTDRAVKEMKNFFH